MAAGVLKNTYFSTINIYFEYLIGLVISIFIARALGPDEFGVYSYLVKVAGICIILTNAGINTGAIKFIAEARAHNNFSQIPAIYRFFQRIQMLKIVIVTAAVALLVFVFPDKIIEHQYRHLLVFLMIAIVFKSAHMFRVGVFKGFERFDYLAFTVLVVAPLNLLLVLSVMFYADSLFNFYVLFSAIACLYWMISGLFIRKLPLTSDATSEGLSDALKGRMKHHLKIVSINTIFTSLAFGQAEILLLKYFSSNESVSFFYIATTISGAALLLVPGVYSSVLLPVIARSVADVKQNAAVKIKESSRYLFTLGIMVAVPTLYYGEQIVTILYGEEFSRAGIILGLFVLVGALNAFKDPVLAYLLSVDKQSLMLKLSLFTFILSISANFVLISQFGLNGAVIAFIGVSLTLIIIMLFIAHFFLKIVPDFKKLFLVVLCSALALTLAVYLADLFDGFVQVVSGFVAFGIVYLCLLVLLNALKEADYLLLENLAARLGNKPAQIIRFMINNRLKI